MTAPEEFSVLLARCEHNAAQRDAAIHALRELLQLFSGREYLTAPQQHALWRAQAVVEEAK